MFCVYISCLDCQKFLYSFFFCILPNFFLINMNLKKTNLLPYRYCVVPLCENSTRRNPNKIFFNVPITPNIRNQWFEKMGIGKITFKEYSPKSSLSCCEDHFIVEEDCENYSRYKMMKQKGIKGVKAHLKANVVPHLFECQKKKDVPEFVFVDINKTENTEVVFGDDFNNANKCHKGVQVRPNYRSKAVNVKVRGVNVGLSPINISPQTKVKFDDNIEPPQSTNIAQEEIANLKKQLMICRMKLRSECRRNLQLRKNLVKQTEVKYLKSKIEWMPKYVRTLLNMQIDHEPGTTFSEDEKKFAMHLHHLSPDTYDFLLKCNFILPSMNTISSWNTEKAAETENWADSTTLQSQDLSTSCKLEHDEIEPSSPILQNQEFADNYKMELDEIIPNSSTLQSQDFDNYDEIKCKEEINHW